MTEWVRLEEGTARPYTPVCKGDCTDAVLSLDTDVSPLNVASCQLAQTTLGAADKKQLDLEETSARSSGETRLNNVTGFFSPDLYQWLCEDVTPQNLCSNAWVPTRARTEPAESTGLPRLLLPPHLPIQAPVYTLCQCQRFMSKKQTEESFNLI